MENVDELWKVNLNNVNFYWLKYVGRCNTILTTGSNKTFSIMYQNIRSIFKNHNEFIFLLKFFKLDPYVLIVTETA